MKHDSFVFSHCLEFWILAAGCLVNWGWPWAAAEWLRLDIFRFLKTAVWECGQQRCVRRTLIGLRNLGIWTNPQVLSNGIRKRDISVHGILHGGAYPLGLVRKGLAKHMVFVSGAQSPEHVVVASVM